MPPDSGFVVSVIAQMALVVIAGTLFSYKRFAFGFAALGCAFLAAHHIIPQIAFWGYSTDTPASPTMLEPVGESPLQVEQPLAGVLFYLQIAWITSFALALIGFSFDRQIRWLAKWIRGFYFRKFKAAIRTKRESFSAEPDQDTTITVVSRDTAVWPRERTIPPKYGVEPWRLWHWRRD